MSWENYDLTTNEQQLEEITFVNINKIDEENVDNENVDPIECNDSDANDINVIDLTTEISNPDLIRDPTGTLPCIECFAGPFNFQVSLMRNDKFSWVYSIPLKRIYIEINKRICFEFCVTLSNSSLKTELYVRALLMYACADSLSFPVKRCPLHSTEVDPYNNAHMISNVCLCQGYGLSGHVITSENENAIYKYNGLSDRHSVLVPIETNSIGNYVTAVTYQFRCLTSCSGGMRRRPVCIIFTLETASGRVVGRNIQHVKIASCPKRDMFRDQQEYYKKNKSEMAKKSLKNSITSSTVDDESVDDPERKKARYTTEPNLGQSCNSDNQPEPDTSKTKPVESDVHHNQCGRVVDRNIQHFKVPSSPERDKYRDEEEHNKKNKYEMPKEALNTPINIITSSAVDDESVDPEIKKARYTTEPNLGQSCNSNIQPEPDTSKTKPVECDVTNSFSEKQQGKAKQNERVHTRWSSRLRRHSRNDEENLGSSSSQASLMMEFVDLTEGMDTTNHNLMENQNPTGNLLGLLDCFVGPYKFQVSLLKNSGCWEYSSLLKRIFMLADKTLVFDFRVTQQSYRLLDQDLKVRALLVYTTSKDICIPVKRCPLHWVAIDPHNNAHRVNGVCLCHDYGLPGHILTTENENAIYEYDPISKRHSVVVPINKIEPGYQSTMVTYKFGCKTSCSGGMDRRPVCVVFTLETSSGKVVGRNITHIKVCSCPKRDMEKEESYFYNKLGIFNEKKEKKLPSDCQTFPSSDIPKTKKITSDSENSADNSDRIKVHCVEELNSKQPSNSINQSEPNSNVTLQMVDEPHSEQPSNSNYQPQPSSDVTMQMEHGVPTSLVENQAEISKNSTDEQLKTISTQLEVISQELKFQRKLILMLVQKSLLG